MGPRAILDGFYGIENPLPPPGVGGGTPDRQAVNSNYTDYDVTAYIIYTYTTHDYRYRYIIIWYCSDYLYIILQRCTQNAGCFTDKVDLFCVGLWYSNYGLF